MRYYQVGGFGVQSWRQSSEELAETHWRPGGVDLIFGVKPTGATYLYRPATDTNERPYGGPIRGSSGYGSSHRRGPVTESRELLSVSPIRFSTLEEFAECLANYTSKKGGNRDNSKANKGLDPGPGARDVPTDTGIARASFEKQRLFLRAYLNTLPSNSLFAINPPKRLQDTRLISFAYSLWQNDNRTALEKKEKPMILDVAWAEFQLDHADGLQLKSCYHVVIQDYSTFKNPKQAEFAYGMSEKMSLAEAGHQFQKFLLRDPGCPIVILIHDLPYQYVKSREVLHHLGVDTKTWHSDLEALDDLLRPSTKGSQWAIAPTSSKDRQLLGSTYYRETSTAGSSFSFHLVDARTMIVKALRSVIVQNDSISSNAQYLRVPVTPGSNTGNDARTLGYMWYTMANGGTFTQQSTSLDSPPTTGSYISPAPQPESSIPQAQGSSLQQGAESSDEDEQDPNDNDVASSIPQPQSVALPEKKVATNPYDALEDDDDDLYDDNSDSDSD